MKKLVKKKPVFEHRYPWQFKVNKRRLKLIEVMRMLDGDFTPIVKHF